MLEHIKNLFDDIKYYTYDATNLREKEVGNFLTPKRYLYDDDFYENMSNNIRHAYASAVLAKDKGENTAKLLGDLYEKTSIGTELSPQGDEQRDLDANAWGRSYGVKYPNYSNEQLLKKLYQDYLKTHTH